MSASTTAREGLRSRAMDRSWAKSYCARGACGSAPYAYWTLQSSPPTTIEIIRRIVATSMLGTASWPVRRNTPSHRLRRLAVLDRTRKNQDVTRLRTAEVRAARDSQTG